MKRRTFTKTAVLGTAGIITTGTLGSRAAMAQQEKYGTKEEIAAAEKEGGLTYYTANFAEVEQEVIKEFNKTFPKIKVAMVRIHERLRAEGRAARLVLQVHDELLLEVPEVETSAVRDLVREEMVGAYPLDPALAVEAGVGDTWADAKD